MCVSHRISRLYSAWLQKKEACRRLGVPPNKPSVLAAKNWPEVSQGWTDVHFRTLCRLLTRKTLLFTEMLPDEKVLSAEREGPKVLAKLLAFISGYHFRIG